ncbi:MAG: hypothetical protein M3O34_03375, partial [Chloroflexota bacterium]|nr:hypothetical protein [Chloroflexota bacterium]
RARLEALREAREGGRAPAGELFIGEDGDLLIDGVPNLAALDGGLPDLLDGDTLVDDEGDDDNGIDDDLGDGASARTATAADLDASGMSLGDLDLGGLDFGGADADDER